MSKQKILIIHDRFMFRGGGERTALILARALNADIATEFWMDGETYDRSEVPAKLFVLDEGEPKPIVWRYFRAHINFLFKTRAFIRNYDTVIFSGNNCLTAAFNMKRTTPRVLYCHHPVRYVYDLLEHRRKEFAWWKRPLYFDLGKWLIRFIYRAGLRQMDTIAANSENVQQRLRDYCSTNSQVVYPPIMIDKFEWIDQEDYYISFARLQSLKRVEDIVHAFINVPDKKLVVCSGGPELERITALARGHSNITIAGWVSDEQLKNYVGNCIANIYIPIDEDFGMTPVEGMSAGKPCIGVNDGGLRESIIEGKTGTLIPKEYTIDDIVSAVRRITPEKAASMKDACIAQSKKFGESVFVSGMKDAINRAKKPVIGIDASRSVDSIQKTGVEVVSDALLKAMLNYRGEFDTSTLNLRFYAPERIPWIPDEKQKVIRMKRLWTTVRLSIEMLLQKPDVLFVPVHTLPFFCPERTVTYIHDIAFKRNPEAYSSFQNWYLNFDLERSIRLCEKVLVPAESVKQDLLEHTDIEPEKVKVIPFGYTPHYENVQTSERKKQVVFIGRLEEKKNVSALVDAFEIFAKNHEGFELILAGKPGVGYESIRKKINNTSASIHELGYVSEEEKWKLLSESACLALVSKEEGFGVPLLEGFDAGLSVVASDIPVLRAIGESACVFVDPNDVTSIAHGLSEAVDNEEHSHIRITRGKERLDDFSWNTAVSAVFSVFRN